MIETLKNDSNLVLRENENLADEVEFEEEAEVEAEFDEKAETEAEFEKESKVTAEIKSGAQDSMGIETKATLSKIQVPVEESTKLEEDEKLQALGYKNSNAADLTHEYEVTLQTLKVIDICEKFEGAYGVFVDNIVVVNDLYGFRLSVMERRKGTIVFVSANKMVLAWTSILCGFLDNGRFDEAKRFFDDTPEKNFV